MEIISYFQQFLGEDNPLIFLAVIIVLILLVANQVSQFLERRKISRIRQFMLSDIDQRDRAQIIIERLENGLLTTSSIEVKSPDGLESIELNRLREAVDEAVKFLKNRFEDTRRFWGSNLDNLGKVSSILTVMLVIGLTPIFLQLTNQQQKIGTLVGEKASHLQQISSLRKQRGEYQDELAQRDQQITSIKRFNQELSASNQNLQSKILDIQRRPPEPELTEDQDIPATNEKKEKEKPQLRDREFRIQLNWSGPTDLDLSIRCPNGFGAINYGSRNSCGGILDEDANMSLKQANSAETITFSIDDMPDGMFFVHVDFFKGLQNSTQLFELRLDGLSINRQQSGTAGIALSKTAVLVFRKNGSIISPE